MRVFLATAKDTDPGKTEEWRQTLSERLPGATVVDGYSDWQENFHRCGGWNGWAEDVATGRTLEGRHRFDVIVCPQLYVGKATAQIVQRAIQTGKAVLFLGKDNAAIVRGIEQEDPESWKSGWRLVCQSSGV